MAVTINGTSGITFNDSSVQASSASTTASVLSATAAASVGAVGTYAFLVRNADSSTLIPGSTLAGSSLVYGAITAQNAYIYNTAVDGQSTTSPSGTWRLMGHFAVTADATKASLWLRIS